MRTQAQIIADCEKRHADTMADAQTRIYTLHDQINIAPKGNP